MNDITTINAFLLYIYIYIYVFINDALQPYTLVLPMHQGLTYPQYGVKSPNTFTSAAPRTYSIICISSESCLWSNVGFARLLCFGTLRSTLSSNVALGELLRLCPGSAGPSTSVEKAKNDCHDKARAGCCLRGLKSLKTFSASGEESALPDLGISSAPNSAFRILGASPKFKILDFYG